jgi:hypothetical protein
MQDISHSIKRIAFLGTPHDGSEKARWAETGRRFLSMFKSTNKELAKDLTPKSEKLAKLSVQFPILLSKRAQNPSTVIDVVCFYEGLSTRRIGVNLDVVSFPRVSRAHGKGLALAVLMIGTGRFGVISLSSWISANTDAR